MKFFCIKKVMQNAGLQRKAIRRFIGESNKNPRLCRGNQGALASGKKPPML